MVNMLPKKARTLGEKYLDRKFIVFCRFRFFSPGRNHCTLQASNNSYQIALPNGQKKNDRISAG
jgi:hypothetical protein